MKAESPEQFSTKDLIKAVQKGNINEVTKVLSTQKKDSLDINKALLEASIGGHEDIVKLLVNLHGIDVNTKDKHESTPLMWASIKGKTKVAKLLVKNGAKVDKINDDGETGLMWACEQENEELADFLIDNGSNVNSKDNDGNTVLMWATEGGLNKIVKKLIAKGAHINKKNISGETALSWSSQSGNKEIESILNQNLSKNKKRTNVNKDPLISKLTSRKKVTNSKSKEIAL